MSEPPLVLLVSGPSTGGIRRHVATLARHLPAHGWQAAVAAPAGVMAGLDCGTATVHDLAVPENPGPLAVLAAARRLRRLARGADVVHAHGLKAALVTMVAGVGVPVVLTLHNVVLDEVSGRRAALLRRIEAWVIGRADEVVAVSPGIARGADRCRDRPTHVALPASEAPVPRRGAHEVRAAHGIDAAAPLVVAVARLHPQKALDVFVAAFARVHADRPDARGLIVGDGPQRAEVESWIREAGLDGVLVAAGPSDHAADEIAAADVVVLSSVWEGAPLVVAEAMQLGRPVVSTDVGAVREMVGDAGVIVAVGAAAALAAGIETVLSDPGEAARLGRVALSRGRDLYGTEPLVAQIAAILSEVRGR